MRSLRFGRKIGATGQEPPLTELQDWAADRPVPAREKTLADTLAASSSYGIWKSSITILRAARNWSFPFFLGRQICGLKLLDAQSIF